MNRVISLVKSLRLRQIMTVILAGLTIFVMQAFGNVLPAQADNTVKSPYGYYYKGTPDENVGNRQFDQNRNLTNNEKSMADNAKDNLKNTADNIREKLNLDEPLPQSTKDFLNSTQEKTEDLVEPITNTREGYYQDR
ncbi:MAG: hypothetical protein KME28_09140 [Pelatocladus maniniholoensis HA4357-MV3]|jgi:peptidoglycan hydrolase CwlO-like protein|uniref:Uncharacterized protein n=1 Tax=Pelatocladus maniniholoensis HA4357-MV3 TaxID=1117104 RepID=A0A9E3LSU3_9NOST|nr:hypothetical protein [Pelatocladus maniniholoensis HA4357-MV3]BAZ68335.1 hypothetical protein NIES4106_30960 [Fischerella sp. NIES-4106]